MKDTKIKFAVVGCGNIGTRHIAAIVAEPEAELVAICDNVKAKLDEMKAAYPSLRSYTDYSEMLAKENLDIVNICSPHHLHAEMSILAVKSKKNVLVEKPMALSTKDCKAMIAAAKKNGMILSTVKQNRHNAPIRVLKKALDEGAFGKIFMVKCDVLWNRNDAYYSESDWRGKKKSEGGSLFTQVSHFVDLLIWLFGDIKDVRALTDTLGHKNIEIEDCGTAALGFKSGVLGNLFWTTCVYNKNYEGSITIIGERGTAKIGGQYLNKMEFWDVQSYPLPEGADEVNIYERHNKLGKSNHSAVIKDLISKLKGRPSTIVDGTEGMKTIAAIETIYKNAK
jgi:UDP-N-acetyl-2-amino-2-deoxyglucuronate dehydrogenase